MCNTNKMNLNITCNITNVNVKYKSPFIRIAFYKEEERIRKTFLYCTKWETMNSILLMKSSHITGHTPFRLN